MVVAQVSLQAGDLMLHNRSLSPGLRPHNMESLDLTNDPYGPMSGRNLVTREGVVEVEDEVEAPVPPIPQQTYHSYCDLHCKARHRRPDRHENH